MTDVNPPSPDDQESESDRRATNIFLAVMFVVLLGAGYWLVNEMVGQRAIDDCASQGRRNCAPLEVPSR